MPKKLMHTRLVMLIVAAALSVGLIACSGSNDTDSGGDDQDDATGADTSDDMDTSDDEADVSAEPAAADEEDAAGDDTGELEPFSLGLSGINASHLWTVIAEDNEIFPEYGVDLEFVVFQGGASQVIPSVLSGSVDVAIGNGQQNMLAQLQEPDLVMIASPMVGSPLSVVARDGIESLDELAGQTISVNAVGGSEDYFSGTKYLGSQGIDIDEIDFVTGGATNARVSALLAGSVDAVFASPPDVQRIEEAGGNVLGEVSEAPEVASTLAYGMIGSSENFEENREVTVRFLQGYQATQDFMREPENRESIVESIIERLNVEEQYAEVTYDFWINTVGERLDPTGAIHAENIEQALENAQADGVEELMDLEPADLDQFYDNSYVEEAASR